MSDTEKAPTLPPRSPQYIADATFVTGWALLNMPEEYMLDARAQFAGYAARMVADLRVSDMLARGRS